MAAHDVVGDAEPEPGALADALGGEERIEDALQMLGSDAAAVVLDLHRHVAVARLGRDPDGAAVADRLAGVHDQVQEHLLELLRHAADGRQLDVEALDPSAAAQLGGRHVQHVLEQLVQIGRLAQLAAGVREALHAAHDLRRPVDALDRFLDQLLSLGDQLGLRLRPAGALELAAHRLPVRWRAARGSSARTRSGC